MVARYVQDKLGDLVSVRDFGASGDGVNDDTQAFQAAIDKVGNASGVYTSIFIPPGTYRITQTIRLHKHHVRFFGAGDKSCLYFDPPSDDMVMLLVQNANPSEPIGYIALENFGLVSNYTGAAVNYKKTGIKFIDASTVVVRGVNTLDWSWQGGKGRGSIGLHLCGRDTHNFSDNIINADQPLQAGQNPNSTTYQFDGHNFSGNWLNILKPTNYAIFFEPGVNPSNWTWKDNNNAYGGTGMIYLNNQGVRTETSSMITIAAVRCESGTNSGGAAGGYGIFMDFGNIPFQTEGEDHPTANPNCGNLIIENFSVNDPTCNGISIKGVSSLTLNHVNLAASGTSLSLNSVNQCEVFSLGIIENGSMVEFSGMEARVLHKLAGGAPSDKSIAYALYVLNASGAASGNLVYENGVRKWSCSQMMASGDEMPLPDLASDGSMIVNVSSDFGASTYSATPRDTFELNSTPEWSAKVKLVSDGSGRTSLVNVRAGLHRFVVTTHGS